MMRDSTSEGSSSRDAALAWSGGGVHALKLACLMRRASRHGAGVQPSGGWRIDTLADSDVVGDSGPATVARLAGSSDLAADGAADLSIADRDKQRIPKMDSSGVITTSAGTGEHGFGMGGVPAYANQYGSDR